MSDGEVTITAEGFTLHYQEKVSTGDYENATVSATLEGSIEGLEVGDDIPQDVRARLLRVSKSLQRDVERAAENRVRISDSENWNPEGGDQ